MKKFLTHPLWDLAAIAGALVLIAKVLHPRIKTVGGK